MAADILNKARAEARLGYILHYPNNYGNFILYLEKYDASILNNYNSNDHTDFDNLRKEWLNSIHKSGKSKITSNKIFQHLVTEFYEAIVTVSQYPWQLLSPKF
jgi:hypothetical protein